ncbi:aldose epimerase family protein [Albimonas pacifica]|uniref:Aldose 1-epimerase n=1 Tax=Albimonas pacifica TaxID=1114924 RepID=A0A1I3GUV7_9RHOB|nr:aldose epimerase family protein [Albimonas pacifica]SFI27122.1 aldose 1-epimerase [Albimonas pacifica]
MTVEIREIARHEGGPIHEAALQSEAARVRLLSWGGVLRDWRAAVGGGWRPCTLGLARFEDYPAHSPAFGAICGRVANRIGGARFALEGREVRLTPNEGRNLLHGGRGLSRRTWRMEAAAGGLRLSYDSPDGEDGFPGAVAFEVFVRLEGARLIYEMHARPDRPTPINLAQHAYWNLDGGGDVLDQRLTLDAQAWAEIDAEKIPTGRLIPAGEGLPDFRMGRTLRGADGQGIAIDHAYALTGGRDPARPAAELESSAGDLRMRLWTDQPSVQVYDAPALSLSAPGLDGPPAGPFGGLCLEAQNFPDAPNRPEFPSPIATPEAPYFQKLEIEIAPT